VVVFLCLVVLLCLVEDPEDRDPLDPPEDRDPLDPPEDRDPLEPPEDLDPDPPEDLDPELPSASKPSVGSAAGAAAGSAAGSCLKTKSWISSLSLEPNKKLRGCAVTRTDSVRINAIVSNLDCIS